MSTKLLAAVAVGGALGSVARYLMASSIGHFTGGGFPWGTLAVNVIGGFVIGALAELMALRWSVSPELRGFLITGILGGFTTFSAFSLEVVTMVTRHAWGPALGYVAASVVISIAAVFCGLWVVRGLG